MGSKIQKNRSDSDMLQGYVEERSFEHQWLGESTPQPRPAVGRKGSKNTESESFLPVKAREELEKATGQKVFLELIVKVQKDWKNDQVFLKQIGLAGGG